MRHAPAGLGQEAVAQGVLHERLQLGSSGPKSARSRVPHGAAVGLRAQRSFLHDGRANNINDAITAHDGQARTSREDYQRLDALARARLIAFLNSL